MLGVVLLCAFLFCGVVCTDALLRDKSGLIRLWTGLVFGLMLMMWMPFLFAYAMTFNKAAQLCGLGVSAVLAVALQLTCGKRTKRNPSFMGDMPLWYLTALVLPLLLLSGYLQYTHTLRETVDGAYHVGQSTYGDLCLHLGIATGFQNAAMPPEYTILPGTTIGYPFLSDSMVATMLLYGTGLSFSFVLTGTLMMALTYTGFVIFAWELTHRKAAVVLAFLFMFINGGLGFLYTFDGVWKDPTALKEVFTGFYKTPTNQPDLNLRWVNVICDMMIPQRTLLAGWTTLLPALYLLIDAARENKTGRFALVGIWGGMMPMIHTHSFFALGMASAGVMAHQIYCAEDKKKTLCRYLVYAAFAALLAGPQLLKWTFPQTVGGGSLKFRFNWSNNQGDGRLIDEYFWFWIKNVGPVYILMIPAVLSLKKGSIGRSFAAGALVIYTVAELIQFQPNPYDNNKLFYVAYMIMVPFAALYAVNLWDKLKGVQGRALFATIFVVVCTLSGALSLARETVSDYELFGTNEVDVANYVIQNTDPSAVFLTGNQHKNTIAALTGRKIVCGTGSYLYFHGIDYSQQQYDEQKMFENPADSAELFEQYDISYAYISDYERYNFTVDEAWFMENCELMISCGSVQLYKLP